LEAAITEQVKKIKEKETKTLLAVPVCIPILWKAVKIPPSNGQGQEPEGSAGFGYLYQPGEGVNVSHSQIRQDLAVQSHSGLL